MFAGAMLGVLRLTIHIPGLRHFAILPATVAGRAASVHRWFAALYAGLGHAESLLVMVVPEENAVFAGQKLPVEINGLSDGRDARRSPW